jgi:hypothetical protein
VPRHPKHCFYYIVGLSFTTRPPKKGNYTQALEICRKDPTAKQERDQVHRLPPLGFRRSSEDGYHTSAGDGTTWDGAAGGDLNGVGEADGAVALPPLSPAGRRAESLQGRWRTAPEKVVCAREEEATPDHLRHTTTAAKGEEVATSLAARETREQAPRGSRGRVRRSTPPRHLGRPGVTHRTHRAPRPFSSSPPRQAGRSGAARRTTTQEHRRTTALFRED